MYSKTEEKRKEKYTKTIERNNLIFYRWSRDSFH